MNSTGSPPVATSTEVRHVSSLLGLIESYAIGILTFSQYSQLPYVCLRSTDLYLYMRAKPECGMTDKGYRPYYLKQTWGNAFIIVPVATHRGRVSLNR